MSTVDLHHNEYVPIHSASGVIRDVAFSPRGDGMVLTASTDKTIKLTSTQSNSVVQRYSMDGCIMIHVHVLSRVSY